MTEVEAAEARALAARSRLSGTVEALQGELAPERLARVALAEVSDGGARAAQASIDVARRNPAAVAGAGALALAVLNRKRIAGLLRRLRGKP